MTPFWSTVEKRSNGAWSDRKRSPALAHGRALVHARGAKCRRTSAMTNEDLSPISAHFSRAGRVADYSDTVLPFNEARRDLVRRTVLGHLRPGSRILEIGCGIRTLTAELAAAGMACTAIDFSAEMIKRAKASIGAAAEVEQTDLFEYKSGQKFAAVIADGVACYYRDKPRFLGHIAELTQPGGFAVIVDRNMLFNLFALNQGTIDFVSEELLKDLPKLARQRITDELNGISGLSVPTLRDQSAELYRSAEIPSTRPIFTQTPDFRQRDSLLFHPRRATTAACH